MAEFFKITEPLDADNNKRTELLEQQKQEQRYLGSTILLPGMKLYEYNYKTGACRTIPRAMEHQFNGSTELGVRSSIKVQYNPDCVYLQALNDRNAIRKLVKAGYIKAKTVKRDGESSNEQN